MTRKSVAFTIQAALLVVAACALGVALWDVATGGFFFTFAGLRISSREAYKPWRIGMLAVVAAIAIRDWTTEPGKTTWARLPAWAPRIAAAAALGSLALGITFGLDAAGGSDAYGYVSQAWLWASGRVAAPNALAVWLTYRLGARVDRPATGMIAAILVATSPIFMFHSFEPMSDVPVTAWWLLSWLAALSARDAGAILSGAAASLAIATRPNLVPLALVLAAA